MRSALFLIMGVIFFTNSLYGQSASGNALNYDGSDDYVQTSGTINITGSSARTVELLFNADTFDPSTPNVLIHWGYVGGDSPHRQSMFAVFGSYLQVDGGNDNYLASYTFSTNTWYHIAFTYNSGTIKAYVNGQSIGSSTNHSWNTDNTVLSVVRGYFTWPMFDGNLDEVRIWNFARTQAQLQYTMNDTLAPAYYSTADSGLAAYYRFDEGSGGGSNSGVTTLPDLSSSALNGTLYNFALSGSSSNWVVSDAPLPVELNNFTAKVDKKEVELMWETATEVNNYGFEIQRAIDNRQLTMDNWDKIGFVEGHGNSNSPKKYSFTDENSYAGKIQYRLKQIDTDGSYEYSDVVEVEIGIPGKFELSQNYPNPFNPTTIIGYSIPASDGNFNSTTNVVLKIFDILGREVTTLVNKNQLPGRYKVEFSTDGMSGGVYIYRLIIGEFILTKKMMLIR